MKALCFYFQIHQPFRLKRYRFFDIGNDHYYYDDFANEDIITRIAQRSYIPACQAMLKMIADTKGQFRVALSITGTAMEQLEHSVPELNDLLRQLAQTGSCEFLSETYDHSLASLVDPDEFRRQVKAHDDKVEALYGVRPKIFRNTELIYCDDIAPQIYDMGFKGVITEGAKHILGWKSPNYLYAAASCPELRLLLKNDKLSDDIAFKFSDTSWDQYPLTADKYMGWIADLPQEEQIVNVCMSLEVLGDTQPRESGIFQFFEALPRFAQEKGVEFWTPSMAVDRLKPVAELEVIHPISWADEARDTTAWLGNKMQQEAFNKLYAVAERVNLCTDRRLKQDWNYLQGSDHFFYMSTKHHADGAMHAVFSPYGSPYEAFTNYMNVLADFLVRVEEQYPASIGNEELNSLLKSIRNQEHEIDELKRELESTRNNLRHFNEEHPRVDAEADSPVAAVVDEEIQKAETPKAPAKRKATPRKKKS